MRSVRLMVSAFLICNIATAQNFQFPTSGNAVNNELPALTAADGVTLITTIRSMGCTPGVGSTFRYGTEHVSTGAIYRNTSWADNCMGSMDIIKMDFTSVAQRPQGLKFSIFDVDNGSDSVSVMIYRGAMLLEYSYSLYSPTFVSAFGASPTFGFVGSAGNNSGLDDNRGRIDISCIDITEKVDSVIVTKYNNRDITGNPSQSFAAFEWTSFTVLPIKILSFIAHSGRASIDFDWTAISETGTETYQVDLSNNGVNFTTVGTAVAAKKPASSNNYSTRIPNTVKPGAAFARLQSKDKSGNIQYSNIIRLSRQAEQPSSVYPVVFLSQVTLTVYTATATKAMLALAGMDGAIHFKQTLMLRAGSNAMPIQLPQRLSPGVYRLYYWGENGVVYHHELLKQ